ncbi:MAG TPA: glycosyltransferase, partial [Blastocatellia bacterium]|nr:glycosyltransferase [Blastocatellia bacterium]
GYLDSAEPGPSILAYTPDGLGLGHLRRNTNIALRFARDTPSGNALVIGAWPTALPAQSAPGVDFIKLPSLQKTTAQMWRSRSLRLELRRLIEIRSSMIVAAIEAFRPDIFLVDHSPIGSCGELEPALDLLKQRSIHSKATRTVLGLRDILDTPDHLCRAWERDGIYAALERYYDLILIYGEQTVFDSAAQYGLNDLHGPKVKYCGYVGADELQNCPDAVASQSAPKNPKRLLIVGGGGSVASPMMSTCIDAIDILSRGCELDCTLITGPLMERRERESLEMKAAGRPVVVTSYVDNPFDYIRKADLIVGMAGYNTLVETIALRKKILVIPRGGFRAEQSLRASIFAEKGYVTASQSEDCSAPSLADSIRRCLDAQDPLQVKLNLNGLTTAVDELRKMVTGARHLQPI